MWQRGVRLAMVLIAAVGVMLALMMAGLWWWSGTEGSLDWALKRVANTQPLQSEGVRGSLRSGLRVQRLVWEREGLRVEAHDVYLEWQPTALVTRTVQLDEFRAALLRVIDRRPASTDPQQPPASLELPFRGRAENVRIARLEWQARTRAEAQELAGAYAFDGRTHQLRVDSLRIAHGRYRAQASLGADGDMPLASTVHGTVTAPVPGSEATVPLTLEATFEGPLADFRGEARLRATGAAPSTGELPQATVTARITPFAALPLREADADVSQLDLSALWPQLPGSLLSGKLQLQPIRGEAVPSWQWRADLRNAAAGPWDRGRLPVENLRADGRWRDGTARVRELQARVGGGTVQAQGTWRSGGWELDGRLERVNPSAVHTGFAPQPVGGTVRLSEAADGMAFDVALQAQGPMQRAAPRDAVAAAIEALELRQARGEGRWQAGRLAVRALDVRTRDASLAGALTLRTTDWAGEGQLRLQAPGLQAQAEGALSERAGRGTLRAQGADLARAQRWFANLPVLGEHMPDWQAQGRATLQLAWQGGWRDPVIEGRLTAPMLSLVPTGSSSAGHWTLHDAEFEASGRLSDALLALRARGEQGARKVSVQASGRGGRVVARGVTSWHANVPQLALALEDPALGAGTWRVALQRPLVASWRGDPARLELAAGEALLTAPAPTARGAAPGVTQALLAWSPTRWGGGELQTAGTLAGLPLAWLELLAPQLAGAGVTGDMLFDARWTTTAGRTLQLDAALVRRSGDVQVMAETLDGGATRVAAGVRDARLTLTGQGENLTLALHWDSERAGTADARVATRLAPGGAAGWHWPANAPLDGFVRAQLPRIGVWSLLAPPGWRLRGALAADVAVGGARNDPRLAGTLAADDLALRSVVEGVELQGGRLRARLDGQRLQVDEFVLHGTGEGAAQGRLVARGEGRWTSGGPQLDAVAQLTRLRASIREDRDLTVSGELAARVDASGTNVRGRLVVDRARIVLPEELPPRLGEDVVVRRAGAAIATAEDRKQPEPDRPPPRRPFEVAVDIDLGPDFRLQGRGLDTLLRGELALTGDSLRQPRLVGTLRTQGGEYRAYGQWLDIERGIMRFTGALDNPLLDILALRPHLPQRVGVRITGTVQSPFIRLYAEPDMPDAEKLTWLVTGRPAPSGGAEAALVQQAALAWLAQRRGGNGGGVAGRVGLDELSFRRDETEGAVVTLGKRFARNFYAAYERSLSGALGTLYIFYDISRRLTLRAEAGDRSAVDLIYTFSFDRVRR